MKCSNKFTFVFYVVACERLKPSLYLTERMEQLRTFGVDVVEEIKSGPNGAENVIAGSMDVMTFRFARGVKIYLYKTEEHPYLNPRQDGPFIHTSRTGTRKFDGRREFFLNCYWHNVYMPVADLATDSTISKASPTDFQIEP